MVFLLLLGSVAGVAWYRTSNALDKVHSVSTPPPEVSGAALGGDEDVTIDTGPAQEALRQQQLADFAIAWRQALGHQLMNGRGQNTPVIFGMPWIFGD